MLIRTPFSFLLIVGNFLEVNLKVQAIRSKGQQARLYVYFPLPLAAAIGLEAGDEVQWELLDRRELHLLRINPSKPRTAKSIREKTKKERLQTDFFSRTDIRQFIII
ncbi:MAG: hypothetical protein R6X19_11105 [Kiritimatiellia bacterium]